MNHAKDPVCEASVLTAWSIIRGVYTDIESKRYYFCSRDCKEKFDSRPAAYTMDEDQWRASDDGMQQPSEVAPDWS